MTTRRGLFVREDAIQGTTPVDARVALRGLFQSLGLLRGLAVTGTSGWTYVVGEGQATVQRTVANGGTYLFGNDGPVELATTSAPATNSRIDRIWIKQNDIDLGDPDSQVLLGVAQGDADPAPVAPAIPASSIEICRVTVPAGATSTNHASVTYSTLNVPRAALVNTPQQYDWGTVVVTLDGTPGGTVPITFAPGRFTTTPLIQLTKQTSGLAKTTPYVQSKTASGAVVGVYAGDNTNQTGSVTLFWEAKAF